VVHTVMPGSSDVGLMLALPAERIPLVRVLSLGSRRTLGQSPREGPGWSALAWLHEAARDAVAERTVADLL
jgi:hypothetical protein